VGEEYRRKLYLQKRRPGREGVGLPHRKIGDTSDIAKNEAERLFKDVRRLGEVYFDGEWKGKEH